MARIGIDATTVFPDGKGISRVVSESIAALARLDTGHELVALVRGPDAERLFAPSGVRCVRVGDRPAILWEQVTLPLSVRRLRLDAVLTTTDRLPLTGRRRYVVWLYEAPTHRIAQNVAHGAGAHQRASDLLTRLLWKGSASRAGRVLAGSQATAAELRAVVPRLRREPLVVYPGLGAEFSPGPVPDRGRYVFHLSSSDPRDNTETALAAFATALPRLTRPARLVVAGGLGDRAPFVQSRIDELGIRSSVDVVGRVSDADLISLYRGAAVHVDASLFEGFGYQVLEAMGCGAPVVGSNATSIPEIVGDAGILCAPTDVRAFADGLVAVLEDDALAARLREQGLARARQFTWERTARALADALEGVLNGR